MNWVRFETLVQGEMTNEDGWVDRSGIATILSAAKELIQKKENISTQAVEILLYFLNVSITPNDEICVTIPNELPRIFPAPELAEEIRRRKS